MGCGGGSPGTGSPIDRPGGGSLTLHRLVPLWEMSVNSEVLPRVRMSEQVQGSSCHHEQRRTNGSRPDHGGVSPSPLLTPAGPQALLRWKVVQCGRGQLQQLRNVALISDVGQMVPSQVLTEEQEKNPRNCQQRVRGCHTPESNNSEYTLGNQLKSKPGPIRLGQTSSRVQMHGREERQRQGGKSARRFPG